MEKTAAPQQPVSKAEVVIVGGGPGGYVAAIRAAQLGKKSPSSSVRTWAAFAQIGGAFRRKRCCIRQNFFRR